MSPKVQPLDVWRGTELPLDAVKMESFVVESPVQINIMDWIGSEFAHRHRCQVWKRQVSDLAGCQAWGDPQPLAALVHLSSDKVPVLSLIEELEGKGWTGVRRQLEHNNLPPLLYDARKPCRPYLQSLLAIKYIFEHGCTKFRSGLSGAHYKLLLKDGKADLDAMTAADCQACLKRMHGDVPVIDDLAAFPVDRGEDRPALEDRAAEDAEVVADPLPAIVDDIDGDDGLDEAGAGDIDGDEGPPEITQVCGAVLRDESRAQANGTWTEGWRITCPVHGLPCSKYRSRALLTERLGRNAAVYYLGAWVQGAAGRDLPTHFRWKPTIDAMRNFMRHPDCP